MLDSELVEYVDKAIKLAGEDPNLYACLRHGQKRSFSSIPQNELGKVLTAVYSLMPPGIDNKALENAFLITLTGMTMWKPETWKHAKSWAAEAGKHASPEQKQRILLELKHIEDFSMCEDAMVERFGALLQRLGKYKISASPRHLLVDLAHWEEDRTDILRKWINELEV